MRTTGNDILNKFRRRWKRLLWLEIFLYAIGPAIFVYFLFNKLFLSAVTFVLIAVAVLVIRKPWKLSMERITAFIDQQLETAEYSSGLLLANGEDLSGLAKLQQRKISERLEGQVQGLRPANHLQRAAIIAGLFLVTGFLAVQVDLPGKDTPGQQEEVQEKVTFRPVDSAAVETRPPEVEDQRVTISYPAYTNLASVTTSGMDVRAVEGSRLSWSLKFNTRVDSVSMERTGNSYPMRLSNGSYTRTSVLQNSGFYSFRFHDTLGNSYVSDLYAIEVTRDQAPVVDVQGLDQFISFDFDEEKQLVFSTSITDDFGVGAAYIIATVTKGSGEAVKFREEKLNFDNDVQAGRKSLKLSKKIDLDELDMEAGDELYFYVEALDLKHPGPNRSRSETFFAVIKDTTSGRFEVEGSLGVDLMPDYFRSQRQLIIDTEKLISNRGKIPKEEFNAISNDLGFDQKALRLRYGQFMGDESESIDSDLQMPEQDQDHEDPLAEFTHDHDGSNEHNLVPANNQEEEHSDGEPEDPLHDYLHNHDDPEESTLFTQSLKSLLRQALNEMWDAELHLRLYEPEKSLPYQYRALEIIQEIKNSARIYVHRIGFDPPPIKEETRLSGDLDEVINFQKREELAEPQQYPAMREAVSRIEELKRDDRGISKADRKLFEEAGNELAAKAIEEPGKHLSTLQQLKWLSEVRTNPAQRLVEVQRGLLLALPQPKPKPGSGEAFIDGINELLLKELATGDQ